MIIVIENTYITELFALVFLELDMATTSFESGRNALSFNFNRGYYIETSKATELEIFYAQALDGQFVLIGEDYVAYDIENEAHKGLEKCTLYVEYVLVSGQYVVYQEGVHNSEALRYYYVERNGLLELDLSFYSSALGVYVQPPQIQLSEAEISLPDAEWVDAFEVRGLAIELRGRMGVTSDGCTVPLGNLLSGVLGDLSATLELSNLNVIINYEIDIYIGFDYNLETKTLEFTDLDLAIKLIRNNNGVENIQAAIYYSNTRGTAYIDLSYYGIPKISIDGLRLTDVLNDLLFGDDESSSETTEDEVAEGSSTTTTEGILTDAATILIFMRRETLAVGISAKVILAIIKMIAGDEISKYLPNIGLELDVDIYPFTMSLLVDLQDADYNKVLGLFLEVYGFDHDEHASGIIGSDLKFFAADEYTGDYIDIDTRSFANILSLNLDADTEVGESVLGMNLGTLSLETTLSIELTAQNVYNWSKYFSTIFGLDEDEMEMIIAILNDLGEPGQSSSILNILLEANVNLDNLLATKMSLSGTEIRITIGFQSTIAADAVSDSYIVLTVVGENANGKTAIYLDFSNYRNKGKHVIELDLMNLLGLGSAISEGALSTGDGDVDTGILGDSLFSILDSILGYIKLEDDKVTIGVKDTIIASVFELLLGDNPNFQKGMEMPLVMGSLSIELSTREIHLDLDFYEETEELDTEGNPIKEVTMGIGFSLVGTKLGFGSTSQLAPEDPDSYRNLLTGDILIELLGYIDFEADATSTTNLALDLSKIFSLITNDSGVALVQNPLFQVRVANDIDKTYYVDTQIYIDLSNFNNLRISFKIYTLESDYGIGIYVDGSDIYIDLSWLGIPKLKIEDVNLGELLNDLLGDTGLFSATAAASDYSNNNYIFRNTVLPYVGLVFMPELFALAINANMVDAIYKVILKSQGISYDEDEILMPSFGDLAIIGDSTTVYELATQNRF